jgi:PAS domain S-box-containing protein
MNDHPATDFDTIDHIMLAEDACDRFEIAWKLGSPPRIEDFLPNVTVEARSDVLRKLIELDVHYRSEDYRKRFPELQGTPTSMANERYSHVSFHKNGGMGSVSISFDRDLGRKVAKKELLPKFSANPVALRLFLQEARITGGLGHPSIVPVYELVKPVNGSSPFYTMRFVSGLTLTEAVRNYHNKRKAGEPVGLEILRLLNAFVTVCQTVAYAHTKGVIHRDLKGDNVVLGEFGEVIVLDWGLAKILAMPGGTAEPGGKELADAVVGFTSVGVVKGTPEFMAPEQAAGRTDLIGPQTDVYGLGAVLYQILTGEAPFSGSRVEEILDRVLTTEPLPPTSLVHDTPLPLEAACLRALAKSRADRHSTASDLATDVQTWLAESAERTRAQQERERFFDLSHELLCTIGAGGQFAINPAWEKTLGWSRDEILSLGFLQLLHPDERESTRVVVNDVAAGEVRSLTFETQVSCKNGTYRWISWTASLLRGEDLVYAVGRDLTERKNAELELHRSKKRFELAVEGSGVGIWDWDLETDESYYSECWKRMIGYEDHEIPHKLIEWESRLHPEDREKALRALHSCTEGDKDSYEVEYRFRHKDGSYRWIHDRGVTIRNKTGVVVRMAGAHSDITDRKRLEQELRKLVGNA